MSTTQRVPGAGGQDTLAWVGHDVTDLDGTRLGTLRHVFLSRHTDRPTWGVVDADDNAQHFVPLDRGAARGETLVLPVSAEQVRAAPTFRDDQELTPRVESDLAAHYAGERAGYYPGYQPGQTGEQPGRHHPDAETGRPAQDTRHSALAVNRSRGAVSAVILVVLGAWGALIPFVGPYFNYAFGPDEPWTYTTDRLWLSILPGVAVILGGLLLGPSANRLVGGLGAWLALVGGVWFVVGPPVSQLWGTPGPEAPIGTPLGADWLRTLEQLGYFYALGALITALAAFALGRLAVRSVKD